ncbi:chorion peroxidase-like isoform X1 [Daphnia pulicaria]|uniref:chorion peroxidase-like isoform X1 n=1 Tax=Daphnia pulicaria TaxID=35523 RepID=UPI001EEC1A6A|nr:chorion peroxidase-like isoform X1 [Daphnia pulicaria]
MPRRATNGGELPHPRQISDSRRRASCSTASLSIPTCWKPWNLKLVLYYILYYWAIYGGNCWSESNKYLVVDLLLKPTERQCLVARTMPDGQFLDEGDLSHGKCIPIEIPQDDPLYSLFRQRCMQFARSATACRTDGRLGHVEQMNQNTHYLDHSGLYGSDHQLAGELRTFEKGALKIFVRPR